MKEYIVPLSEEEAFYGYKDMTTELIRCKDCKLCEVYYHGPQAPDQFTHFCNWLGMHVAGNDYCSMGQRKEE